VKKFALIFVALIIVLLLTPPLLGMRAQDQLEQSITRLAVQSGAYIDISLEDYESNWFSSSGRIQFRVSSAFLEANPLFQQDDQQQDNLADAMRAGFSQQIDVLHGPLLLGEQTSFGLGTVVSTIDGSANPGLAELLSQTGNDYFLRSSMKIGFTGMGDISVEAPPFQIDRSENQLGSVIFAGATANGHLNLADLHMVIEGQVNGLSFIGNLGEAVIESISFSGDMAYPESDPYGLGHGKITLDRLVAINEDQTTLDLSSAKVEFASTKDSANKIDLSITYAIEALNAPDASFRDMQITFIMAGLDPHTLVELQTLGNTLAPEAIDSAQALAQLTTPIYDILAGGASLSVNPVRFIYNDQPFQAALKMQSKPANLPARDAFSIDNPMLLLNLFAIDADLLVDAALALEVVVPLLKQQLAAGVPQGAEVTEAELEDMARAQAPMVLGTLITQGILRQEGSNYVVNARYDNGELVVNGNPFPLGAVFGQGN
jgi:uncharacterized protein YdgA (DUF945 family)